ncbi:MAG: hypothetical protein LQ337_004858 [Flavoplaca oasis]|nr:MAG: hypothetical protein LQ337_004858 [Flavoplaca oasis]
MTQWIRLFRSSPSPPTIGIDWRDNLTEPRLTKEVGCGGCREEPKCGGIARNINVEQTAGQFDVDLSFLLQQAAWLYERQLSQVKAQLRKVSKPSLTTQSPTPSSAAGSGVAGGYAMARTSSGGSRVPSSLAMRQMERPVSQGEGSPVEFSSPARGARMSRNSSTSTVHQVQRASPTLGQRPSSEALSPAIHAPRAREASRRLSDLTQKDKPPILTETPTSPSSKADDSSSSSSEAEAAPPLSRSRAYMRRPRHSSSKAPLGPLSDADEEDADSPPFLPFSNPNPAVPAPASINNDPSATLRTAPHLTSSNRIPMPAPVPALTSSSSSAQSSQPHKRPSRGAPQKPTSPPHHHTNEPASALSPRQRRVVKDGSEGTPSMGSSFSDLDDASVTQSALEEALAHEMNQGGVASRMSTISQALRSRYL